MEEKATPRPNSTKGGFATLEDRLLIHRAMSKGIIVYPEK